MYVSPGDAWFDGSAVLLLWARIGRVYFSVQLITICAVVNLERAPEKATCAVVNDCITDCSN